MTKQELYSRYLELKYDLEIHIKLSKDLLDTVQDMKSPAIKAVLGLAKLETQKALNYCNENIEKLRKEL